MRKYSDLEFLMLPKWRQWLYAFVCFLVDIPSGIWNGIKKIGSFIVKACLAVKNEAVDIVTTFTRGDWKTKVSYLVMGFGNLARGQILRGLLFLAFEGVFIFYMIFAGVHWLSQLGSLGTVGPYEVYDEIYDSYTTVYGDNSFKILLCRSMKEIVKQT